jgi:hypothetical protein
MSASLKSSKSQREKTILDGKRKTAITMVQDAAIYCNTRAIVYEFDFIEYFYRAR